MVGYVAYVPSTMAPEVVVDMLIRCSKATIMTIWVVPSAVSFWQTMEFATRDAHGGREELRWPTLSASTL
jgi:hypothetical protein